MKKKSIFIIILIISITLLLGEVRNGDNKIKPDFSVSAGKLIKEDKRNQPEYFWSCPPQSLLINYADYFQCYNQTPVSYQLNNGGTYIFYRVKDQGGNSEIAYTYIDSGGNMISSGLGYEGCYCDSEVDQISGDVFCCWHAEAGDGITTDCQFFYDLYHLMGGTGLWKNSPVTVIDSDEMDNLDPTENDEFIWPELKIGASPQTGKQRVYLVASNRNSSDGETGFPSENVMLSYADFSTEDLSDQSDLEWEYTTIETMDNWNVENPSWYRSYKSWTVIENMVIFMGYVVPFDCTEENVRLFCFINENYGEGDWDEYYQDFVFSEENPSFIDPVTGDTHYLYSNLQYSPDIPYESVQQHIMHSGNFNLIPVNNGTGVMWAGAMGVTFYDGTEIRYRPNWLQIYPKAFSFDLITYEFSFNDVYPQGANPGDNVPVKPWDLNEDGEIDSFDANGFPQWVMDWPVFHWDALSCCYYNQYYLSSNEENGWLALVWTDGSKCNANHQNWTGYEDYFSKPEIAVCISNDYGESWSEPIFMNACESDENYCCELDGMIPCFIYPGDHIREAGNGNGILPLFFIDDNDYGSYHSLQHGMNNGSTYQYGELMINFNFTINETIEKIKPAERNCLNYPNPFNPQTWISFECDAPGNVKIEIYDIKGRLIRRLYDQYLTEGEHKVLWKGKNEAGLEVASGMYLYKIETSTFSAIRKMILMK